MAKPNLTQEQVRRLFDYDAERGLLIWRERPASDFKDGHFSAHLKARMWNGQRAGKVAGCLDDVGYRSTKINGACYLNHKLIWLYHHGEWPHNEIDHIENRLAGDHIENLRVVDKLTNMKNCKLFVTNTSGACGVYRKLNRWQASITADGKKIHLGSFVEKADAISARKEAQRRFGFHENHGREFEL